MTKTISHGFVAGCLAVLGLHRGAGFLLHRIGTGIPAVVGGFGRAPAPFTLAPGGAPRRADGAFAGLPARPLSLRP